MANNEEMKLNERINEFVRKNRKSVFIFLVITVLAFAGTITGISLSDVFRKKAISEVEEYSRRYEALRFTIGAEPSSEELEKLLADLTVFAKKTSGYAGGRAWSIIAAVHYDKKEWAEAEAAWRGAAKTASKTYLAPVAFYSAAVAAEEQGKNGEAIELYSKSVSHTAAFPAAAHTQFSIGRLYEGLNDTAAALEAYRQVPAKWPNDAIWVNFAHSRIIAIEAGTD